MRAGLAGEAPRAPQGRAARHLSRQAGPALASGRPCRSGFDRDGEELAPGLCIASQGPAAAASILAQQCVAQEEPVVRRGAAPGAARGDKEPFSNAWLELSLAFDLCPSCSKRDAWKRSHANGYWPPSASSACPAPLRTSSRPGSSATS